MESLKPIEKEIRRLSLRVAIARYDLQEAILNKTSLELCGELCKEIAVCQLQISALRNGRFKELPYPIRHLYL